MANVVTGTTNTSGALTVVPTAAKSIIVVGVADKDIMTPQLEIFDITGTTDAVAKFGPESMASKIVRIMITNGADFIKGIVVPPSGAETPYATISDAYSAAFSATLIDNTIRFVIVDTLDDTVLTALKTHLDAAESEDLQRYSITGVADSAQNTALVAAATAINNKRVFVVGPNPVDSVGTQVSGIITAAAVAASVNNDITKDPALPMNGVTLAGFYGMTRTLLKADKTVLVNGGVVPIINGGGNVPTIYRMVTSRTKDAQDATEIIWQEGSTVFIADNVLDSVETILRANYQRTKNVARILGSIKTDVINTLQRLNDLEIIQNFNKSTVSVVRDPDDLYGALVNYEFQVVTPLYTITIEQHMKL